MITVAACDQSRPTATGPDEQAWNLAEVLGAVQEARRLGSPVVGTEHVLMASLADPTVRWALAAVGADMRAVQTLVGGASAARTRRRAGDDRGLTPRAASVVIEVSVDPSRLADAGTAIDRTRALRAAMTWFLTSGCDCAARGILDELGVTQHRARLVATLQEHAGPSELPRPRPPS